MQSELTISFSTLYAFLLVLTRVSSLFVFVPLPGSHAGPTMPRAVASMACTMALYARWPVIDPVQATPGLIVAWVLSEAALGMVAGIAVGFVTDALLMGAQLLSLQAGYGYASVVDPTTQADSGVLLVISQLMAGMLFFAFGLDRQIVYALAGSLTAWPPGEFVLTRPMAQEFIKLASHIFSVGFRIALPVAGLLVMVDLALALLGRMHSQLQITSLAFPLKMVVGLLVLAWVLVLYPTVYENYAKQVFRVSHGILVH